MIPIKNSSLQKAKKKDASKREKHGKPESLSSEKEEREDGGEKREKPDKEKTKSSLE